MKKILISIWILVLLTSCARLESYVLAPTATQFTAADPEPMATLTPAPTAAVKPTETPQWSVCTGVERGRLNLRACAGTGCASIAILTERQIVRVSGVEEGQWVMVTQPKNGWVNAHYLCKESP